MNLPVASHGVSDRTYSVIEQHQYIMALMYIFTHNLRLRPLLACSKLREMNPKRLNFKIVNLCFSLHKDRLLLKPFYKGSAIMISNTFCRWSSCKCMCCFMKDRQKKSCSV